MAEEYMKSKRIALFRSYIAKAARFADVTIDNEIIVRGQKEFSKNELE